MNDNASAAAIETSHNEGKPKRSRKKVSQGQPLVVLIFLVIII
jgi:hypothetical protein